MVEFALVSPLLLLLVFGLIDFGRIIQANTTVAEAARMAVRQAAANADSTDQPYGTADSNPCSGTAFTSGATGHGCLTNGRIRATVASILSSGNLDGNPTLRAGVDATSCTTTSLPAAGLANVCVNPDESGTAPGAALTTCATATTSLGHQPKAGELGTRKEEWTTPKFKGAAGVPGCYLIQVTVIYTYRPFTGLLQRAIGTQVRLSSSSATIAEY
jgi:Flp pilus assembly protein TadG